MKIIRSSQVDMSWLDTMLGEGPLPAVSSGSLALAADVAYWFFVGRVTRPVIVRYAACFLSVIGVAPVGAFEVCLASMPSQPDGTSKTITKIAAEAINGAGLVTAVTRVRNATPFTPVIPAGTLLVLGCRCDNVWGTRPSFSGMGRDLGFGRLMQTATAGALTGSGPWTGTVNASGSAATAVHMNAQV